MVTLLPNNQKGTWVPFFLLNTVMKTTEIIIEANSGPYGPRVIPGSRKTTTQHTLAEKVRKYIDDNCQPWLQQAGRQVVYRGMNVPQTAPEAFTRVVRSDRKPKDTSKRLTVTYNAVIAAAGGVANRTNSAFVSGDDITATNYGAVYVVLPVGDFRYTWSSEYADWTEDFAHSRTLQYLPDKFLDSDPKTSKLFTKEDLDYIKQETLRLKQQGYSKAMLSGLTKNMIKKIHNARLSELVKFDDPKFYDKRKVKAQFHADRRLKEAIKSGHEIMIHSEKILCVDKKFYEGYIL